jgi:hypothetical protein
MASGFTQNLLKGEHVCKSAKAFIKHVTFISYQLATAFEVVNIYVFSIQLTGSHLHGMPD